MKKYILYLLTFITLALQGLAAQTVQNGSRLNMTVKKKHTTADNLKFGSNISGLTYKPLSIQNPEGLNRFYRSFLFASAANSEVASVAEVESSTKSASKRTSAVETAVVSEENLYASDKIVVSNIYPNPASEFAELDYSIHGDVKDAKLIFYNVLGSKMSEHALSKSNGKLRVDTTVMPTGLYFYQLSLEGKKVATKKMLVRHQQ